VVFSCESFSQEYINTNGGLNALVARAHVGDLRVTCDGVDNTTTSDIINVQASVAMGNICVGEDPMFQSTPSQCNNGEWPSSEIAGGAFQLCRRERAPCSSCELEHFTAESDPAVCPESLSDNVEERLQAIMDTIPNRSQVEKMLFS